MSGAFKTNVHSTDINDQIHHGKFRSVVTVAKNDKFADFNCADAAYGGDDAACIQAAIDYCAAHSIIELWVFDGTYIFSVKITCTIDIIIRGIGKVTLVSSQTSGASPEIFDFSGSKIATITGSDVLAGSVTITVSDASNIRVGDLLLISDNTKWNVTDYPNLNTGELHEVDSISDLSISFIDGLLHSYTSANSLSIDVIRPISVSVDNIEFKGTSSTIIGGLVQLHYCNNSQILNSIFSDDGYYGISVYNCLDTLIFNNKMSNFRGSGYGYGIIINDASAHTTISKNKIRLCRHCIAAGGYESVGQARDICIDNNTLFGGRWTGAEHIIDAHPCVESISASNNTIYCNTRSAFISGAKLSEFYSNKIYNGAGASIRGNTQNINYFVHKNRFYSCGYAFADSLTENCSVVFASIQNNYMINSVYYIARTRVTSCILVIGNHIDQTIDYHGIEISNATTGIVTENHLNNVYRNGIVLTNCSNLLVSLNSLINCCQRGVISDLSEAGIAVKGSSNININNNLISDTNEKMYYCIKEYTTSDNNIIQNNTVSGAITKQILKLGTGTKVTQNNGHTTENTGTATLLLNTTSITVSHGLAATPTNVIVTPKGNIGSYWWDTPTATTFIIHCSTAPASNTDVNWTAIV